MGNPTVTPIGENWHALEFLVAEAAHHYSGDIGLITGGAVVLAGTVLGKEITGGAATAAAFSGNTGNGAMGAITVGTAAKVGVYKLTIIEPAANAGEFVVEDPDGVEVGTGAVGAAFSGGGLGFTLADGATDFVSGDGFSITVTATGAKYGAFDPTATNGLQNAAAILGYPVDATSADKQGTIFTRQCQINASELIWGANVTTAAQKTAALSQLAGLGIIAR